MHARLGSVHRPRALPPPLAGVSRGARVRGCCALAPSRRQLPQLPWPTACLLACLLASGTPSCAHSPCGLFPLPGARIRGENSGCQLTKQSLQDALLFRVARRASRPLNWDWDVRGWDSGLQSPISRGGRGPTGLLQERPVVLGWLGASVADARDPVGCGTWRAESQELVWADSGCGARGPFGVPRACRLEPRGVSTGRRSGLRRSRARMANCAHGEIHDTSAQPETSCTARAPFEDELGALLRWIGLLPRHASQDASCVMDVLGQLDVR